MNNKKKIGDITWEIISGGHSTIENNNNGFTLTDELIKDFEDFNENNQDDGSS